MAKEIVSVEERFWRRVNKNGPVVREDIGPCWLWTREIDAKGWGVFYTHGKGPDRKRLAVHHYAYRLLIGEIPKWSNMEPLCGIKYCCNPSHWKVPTTEDRFWSMVRKDGPVPAHRPELGPCWPWQGSVDGGGYGMFREPDKENMSRSHIVSYVIAQGLVPGGLELDHICHNPNTCHLGKSCPHRRCVNPDHLEAVTALVNRGKGRSRSGEVTRERMALITHCPQGHPYNESNTAIVNGKRRCVECNRKRSEDWRRDHS